MTDNEAPSGATSFSTLKYVNFISELEADFSFEPVCEGIHDLSRERHERWHEAAQIIGEIEALEDDPEALAAKLSELALRGHMLRSLGSIEQPSEAGESEEDTP